MRRATKIRWIRLAETDSTNEYAKGLQAVHNTVVTADRQTAGKGRDGRSFASEEGGVYMSVVRMDDLPVRESAKYYLAAPLAVADALAEWGLDARIKWPNDVRVGDAKIAGILVETVWENDRVKRAVVGIGVNVRNDLGGVPVRATSMRLEGADASPREVAKRIACRLDERLAQPLAELIEAIKEKLINIGRAVVFGDGTEGVAVDLADDGRLVVLVGDKRRMVAAGDVSLKEEIC